MSEKPESTQTEGVGTDKRDGKGRFRPGVSGNPGGLPKEVREARATALTYTSEMMETAVKWMRSGDKVLAPVGLNFLANRALGREGKLSELPTPDAPDSAAVPSEVTTTEILGMARQTVGLMVKARMQAVLDGGGTAEDLAQMVEATRMLSVVEKEDREQKKLDEASKLPTEEVVRRMLDGLSVDDLKAAIARREGQP